MTSKSEEILNYVVFIVARLVFGISLAQQEAAQQEATQYLVKRALMSYNLHEIIAEIVLGERE